MDRAEEITRIRRAFDVHPAVGLLGPRQVGKTTLAREYASLLQDEDVHFFDLENPRDLIKFEEPQLLLEPLKGLIVIDEVQRAPEIFALLRVLIDRPRGGARFLLLGSASRDLIRQSSETLAGRIEYVVLPPFSLPEVGLEHRDRLWLRGGYPRAYLAKTDEQAFQWLEAYIKTYLERDLPSLGFRVAAETIRRFWTMLAHYHGQVLNASELGRSLDQTGKTINHHLDILVGTFMVRKLLPWHENIKKRQVKAPKIFLRDAGVLHTLLGTTSMDSLKDHPKLGASWEGFAMEQILSTIRDPHYFWAVHSQAELDLLVMKGRERTGYEFKYSASPKVTQSMTTARDTLGLDQLHVVYPGTETYPLGDRIEAVGLSTALGL
jgi:predicted AAA+ superfamily ATPase